MLILYIHVRNITYILAFAKIIQTTNDRSFVLYLVITLNRKAVFCVPFAQCWLNLQGDTDSHVPTCARVHTYVVDRHRKLILTFYKL